MTHVFYRDIEDTHQWYALQLTVKSNFNRKPDLYFSAGANHRIKLIANNQPILWLTQHKEYAGVWCIRNWSAKAPRVTVIPPITSAAIEKRKYLTHSEQLKSWNRFFIEQTQFIDKAKLIGKTQQNTLNFFYHSDWLLQAMPATSYQPSAPRPLKQINNHWSLTTHAPYAVDLPKFSLSIDDVNMTPDITQPVCWVDWWNGESPLIHLNPIDFNSDRLKWWRKKAREQQLPPIFIWYVSCLDSYLLIDGHYRLQAAIIEQKIPDFIVITTLTQQFIKPDPDKQQRILNSILHKRPTINPLSVEQINELIIPLFSDYTMNKLTTRSWVNTEPEQIWIQEVKEQLTNSQKSELIDNIIRRQDE